MERFALPPAVVSDQILIRLPPALNRQFRELAGRRGASLGSLAVDLLSMVVPGALQVERERDEEETAGAA